uniref:Uncharacterized protein n=1 Tax=Rhodococcus hoagii TaxID=43767 RepID=A0A1Z1UZ30_RHOHA|nr:hypothetical protein pVAPN1572_0801 [Prescottella equi]
MLRGENWAVLDSIRIRKQVERKSDSFQGVHAHLTESFYCPNVLATVLVLAFCCNLSIGLRYFTLPGSRTAANTDYRADSSQLRVAE